jgi:hypothetical protein
MRKVVATLFSSVDGDASGRDPDDMDWVSDHQGPEALELGLDALRDLDLLVLGRVTDELFAADWPSASQEAEGDLAGQMNSHPKVVCSTTLTEPSRGSTPPSTAARWPPRSPGSSSPAGTSGSRAATRWCGRRCGWGCSTACSCRPTPQ